MVSNQAQTILLVVGTLLPIGCAIEVQPPPVLAEVCQTRDSATCIDWAYAAEETDLALLGEHLHDVYEVDLGAEAAPLAKGTFRAWIGGVELQEVRPSETNVRGRTSVLGHLPGVLVPGDHPVEIETPAGQRAVRASAFRVRDPLDMSVAFEKTQLPVGDTNRLTITIDNSGASDLTDVRLDLSQGTSGSYLLPEEPAPFSIAGESSFDVSLDLVAGSPGQPQVAVVVNALAAGRIPVGATQPVTGTTAIILAAALDVTAEVRPSPATAGSTVELVVTAENTGGAAILQARLHPPQTTGSGSIDWGPDLGQVRTIEPGEIRELRWSGVATSTGQVSLQPRISGTEAISSRTVEATTTQPISVEIQ